MDAVLALRFMTGVANYKVARNTAYEFFKKYPDIKVMMLRLELEAAEVELAEKTHLVEEGKA